MNKSTVRPVRQWITASLLVFASFLLYQLPTLAFDVSGVWTSDWGKVHLQQSGLNRDGSAAITGYWDQSATQRGLIRSGGFTRASRLLWFDYYQPWNKQSGRATFTLKNSGTTLDGTYKQSNQAGNWVLTRSSYISPQSVQTVNRGMTKGEVRKARKDARKARQNGY